MAVERFVITPEQAHRWNFRTGLQARFTGLPERPVRPGRYTRLIEGRTCWMSDTAAECVDHLPPVIAARKLGGRVLINGLGLGLVLSNILRVKYVEHVTVVEFSPDVVKLVGPSFKSDPRVTIINGDAHTHEHESKRWEVVWHDIWARIDSDNLLSMVALRERFEGQAAWQGCWSETEARIMAAEEAKPIPERVERLRERYSDDEILSVLVHGGD